MENKPMSIVISELKEGIVTIVNNSGLPIYIGEMILKDILTDVTMLVIKYEKENIRNIFKQSRKKWKKQKLRKQLIWKRLMNNQSFLMLKNKGGIYYGYI